MMEDTISWPEVIAVLIAALALIVSLYEILSNRPRLRVTLKNAITGTPEELVPFVNIEIVNYGKQPTTIRSICFRIDDNKYVWVEAHQMGQNYPSIINPGEISNFYFLGESKVQYNDIDSTLFDLINSRAITPYFEHSWKDKRIKISPMKRIKND